MAIPIVICLLGFISHEQKTMLKVHFRKGNRILKSTCSLEKLSYR